MTHAQFYINLLAFVLLVVAFRFLQPTKEVKECQEPPVEQTKLLNLFPKPRFPRLFPKFLFVRAKLAAQPMQIAYVEQPTEVPSTLPTALPTVAPTPVPVATSFYKEYIYQHESGNDPTRWNNSGCVGLGQDCNGRIVNLCPTLDYACEDNYFTSYMLNRYGSWENAYYFWIAHNWW